MLTNILEPRHVDREGELQTAFQKAGADIQSRNFDTPEEVMDLLHDPRVRDFLAKFQDDAQQLSFNYRDQQILCVGILLLTLGKDVNPDNYDGWIKNRLRTFQGALGISPTDCCWTEGQCPPQESLTDRYRFLTSSFLLRRLIFRICVSGARDNYQNKPKNAGENSTHYIPTTNCFEL